MSRHWNPEADLARVRRAPGKRRAAAAAAATPWTSPDHYAAHAPNGWSDNRKAALVLALGACAWLAAGLAQAW